MATPKAFSMEVRGAWNLFAPRWLDAVLIALTPLIPLLLLIPYIAERLFLRLNGAGGVPSSLPAALGLIGVFAAAVVSVIAKAALFILFRSPTRVRAADAIREGTRRFLPFLWTEALLSLLIAVALLPVALLVAWYSVLGRPRMTTDPASLFLADTATALGVLVLFLPALALSVWFAFAPIAAAVRDARGGVEALGVSAGMVRGAFWPLVGRLLAWTVLVLVISAVVSPLPIANWLIPFLLTLLGGAFLIVLYREFRGR